MPEHETPATRAVFDYEQDAEDLDGRNIADWGGDELFQHGPRRRFARTGAGHRTRGAGETERRVELHDPRHAARYRPAQGHAHRAAEPGDAEPVALPEMLAEPSESDLVEEPNVIDEPREVAGPVAEAPARRTVTITGRPGPLAVPPGRGGTPARRRPPRTVVERLGSRPDRIAAWAFGLGLTLILIAISTADAATI